MFTFAEGNSPGVMLSSSDWLSLEDHVASETTVFAILASNLILDSVVCLKSRRGRMCASACFCPALQCKQDLAHAFPHEHDLA